MEDTLFRYIDAKREEMLRFLRELVETQSGTYNKTGVDQVGRMIRSSLSSLPLATAVIEQENYGGLLIANTDGKLDKGCILLTGHMDTAFRADSSFRYWREDDRHAFGPGVIDMKGGLVAGIYALKALEASGALSEMKLQFIVNSEEEIGSPVSRSIIAAAARKSAMALVLECGGLKGEVVTGRKGRLGLKIFVHGRGGHAAKAGAGKSSAVLALAHKIIDLESLNGSFPELSVNIGQISGGTGPNVVPEESWATIDVRFSSAEGLEFLSSQLEQITGRVDIPGTKSRIEKVSERPVMEATQGNKALFGIIAEEAGKLGIPVTEEFRAGASDANIIAAEGTPVVDGLGPVGEHDHSNREYMIKETLFQRSKLLAASIRAAWRRHHSGNLFGHRMLKELL